MEFLGVSFCFTGEKSVEVVDLGSDSDLESQFEEDNGPTFNHTSVKREVSEFIVPEVLEALELGFKPSSPPPPTLSSPPSSPHRLSLAGTIDLKTSCPICKTSVAIGDLELMIKEHQGYIGEQKSRMQSLRLSCVLKVNIHCDGCKQDVKKLLQRIEDQSRSTSLDWAMRRDIILGIARGVLYLHQGSKLRIVHRDLKATYFGLLTQLLSEEVFDFSRGEMTQQKIKELKQSLNR
ncbi:hypothetical protein Syun_020923 [Stephania yunnanensis]|uniref:Protein kinase domain-containing protein n=1 Tax=Stephania yunnanensis TaxID=152371 RepID=A0AAP0IET5_9MAGN